ncbi:MAG: AbrB/MazE/SpoVT family DNA-binding domain-containing protein [Bacteroidota bacterium]
MEIRPVTARGQLVIPARIRKKYRIKKGARIGFVEDDKKLTMHLLDRNYFLSFAGILGTDGKMLESLMLEKKWARRDE